jgi:hypothetical protein
VTYRPSVAPIFVMRSSMRRLNLAGLLMQPGGAGMGLGLLAVHPCDLGIGGGISLGFGLPLVLECPGRPLFRAFFAFQGRIVETPITHPRNIAPRS